MWFFDDENGNSLSFNDFEDESENTVIYFLEKDGFTGEDSDDTDNSDEGI